MEQVLSRMPRKVTDAMGADLTRPYTAEEVSKAVKQMHPLKSPGPDGMSPIFYQKFWHIIRNDVVTFVLDFLNNGVFDPSVNYTHIVLIPKVAQPDVTQFRPISLCNVVYRIASKVIANRLRVIIPSIIFEISFYSQKIDH